MAKSVQITVKPPLSELKADLKRSRDKIAQTKRPFQKASIFLDRWVQRNFKSEGGNVGNWLPFKYGGRVTTKGKSRAKSIDGRKNINPSAKLLQDKGRLRASYLPFASKKDAGIGSSLPYAEGHEKGKGVPKRRVLPRSIEVMPDILKIFDNHVNAKLNQVFDEVKKTND